MPFIPKTIDTEPPLIALTIAGFDPSGGAGITADLKTFAAHGLYGVACMTAATAQSTMGVRAVEVQPAEMVRQTLQCLAEDVCFAGVKIGMLGGGQVASEVSSFLSRGMTRSRVVLDPVLRSTSGTPLLDAAGVAVLRMQLLSQIGWITPNLNELSLLTEDGSGETVSAARKLKRMVAESGNDELNIVVTGGHLDRPNDFLLTALGEEIWIPGERVETSATHGTGCAFSSALLCSLIAGRTPLAAVQTAKDYVTEALRSAYPIGRGKGPMNHLFPLKHREK